MPDAIARGRLTVYLGAAPGVGKTCAMLDAAQALRQGGVDVVVGVVLTHGRAETAARLAGLETLPLREQAEGGVVLREFDLAAALGRRPAVLLVDELAHTNAPGSRHAKRWQDVEDLLEAGIGVITTLNVQHLESLHEPVARLTGVEVRERVPDGFLARADAIEVVDLPTEVLLERVRTGKVYHGDGAVRALEGFFTPENLAGLRELALRYVAGRVRAGQEANGLAAHRQPAERLLVAIGPSPTSARLIRAAKRMADATGGTWVAVHAETAATLHLSAQDRARIGEHLRLVERLGGQTLTIGGDDAARGLIEAARRQGARRILVGKPAPARWYDRWRGSLVHDLLRVSGDIEVLAIAGDGASTAAEPEPAADAPQGTAVVLSWVAAVAAVVVAVVVALPLRPYLQPANLTLPFLLAVVGIALLGRRGPVILTTVAGVAVFDLLCVPPYGSFAVSDTEYVLTFLGMLVVGLTIAHLVARQRRQIDQALDEAEGAAALHRLGSGLATTRGLDQVVRTATSLTGEILGCRAVVLITEIPGSSRLAPEPLRQIADAGAAITPAEVAVAQWVATHGHPAGLGTDTLPAATGLHLPLAIPGGATGVLVLTDLSLARTRDPAWRRLAEAAARLTALAIGCERLYLQATTSQHEADHAELRATLLAGVSHDLRTPLTAISGLAQQLADDPDPDRRSTALTIAEQADRLATTVRNLLELTRLGSGSVRPQQVPLAAEDAIATALAAVRPRAPDRSFTVAADCPPLAADETLLHTALINLLDNALVHTSGPIDIAAGAVPAGIAITVADRGPGIPPAERSRIFAAWQRGTGAAAGGAGLGLALVRAIAQAHGGDIAVEDRVGGGAVFRLTMPRHGDT